MGGHPRKRPSPAAPDRPVTEEGDGRTDIFMVQHAHMVGDRYEKRNVRYEKKMAVMNKNIAGKKKYVVRLKKYVVRF